MGAIGGPELLLVFLVVLLVFGPRRLPELARAMGRALGEIRRLSTELRREINLAELDEPQHPEDRPPKSPDRPD